jgi:hypothetical protein
LNAFNRGTRWSNLTYDDADDIWSTFKTSNKKTRANNITSWHVVHVRSLVSAV